MSQLNTLSNINNNIHKLKTRQAPQHALQARMHTEEPIYLV